MTSTPDHTVQNYFKSVYTLVGISLSDLPDLADAQLPVRAYREVKGSGVSLTEIVSAYVREWLNTHFGICGVGWGYAYDPADLKLEVIPQVYKRNTPQEYTKDQWFATLRSFTFWYKTQAADGVITRHELQASGASDNSKQAYALKGAVTAAISNAVSLIGFQSSVYKGERTHVTVRRKPAGKRPPAQKVSPAPAKNKAAPAASSGDNPAGYIVPIGNHQGERLGDQDIKSVQFYARMKTNGNPELVAFQNAAAALLEQVPA